MHKNSGTISAEAIASHVLHVRGQPVLLDSDLASFYGVAIHIVQRAVHEYAERLPDDFVFRLSPAGRDARAAKANVGSLYAFNEQGASMFAAFFASHSTEVSIAIMRAFNCLRRSRPPVCRDDARRRMKRRHAPHASRIRGVRPNRNSRI
jgi:hypothetical protein